MFNATEIVVIAFAITNSMRVFAYVPQIMQLARDNSGAAAVSVCTWFLFLLSNISTAAYAALVLNEPCMTVVFAANTVCSTIIVVLTVLRRRRISSQLRPRGPRRQYDLQLHTENFRRCGT
jgi:hypothetical protein